MNFSINIEVLKSFCFSIKQKQVQLPTYLRYLLRRFFSRGGYLSSLVKIRPSPLEKSKLFSLEVLFTVTFSLIHCVAVII